MEIFISWSGLLQFFARCCWCFWKFLAAFPPLCFFLTTAESMVIKCIVETWTNCYDCSMTFIFTLKEYFFRKLKSFPPDLTAYSRRLLHGAKESVSISEILRESCQFLPSDSVTNIFNFHLNIKLLLVILQNINTEGSPFSSESIIHLSSLTTNAVLVWKTAVC